MSTGKRLLGLFLAITLLAVTALADDIIKMKNGTVRKGKIVEETETHYILEKFGTRFKIAKDEVAEVKRGVKTKLDKYRELKAKTDRNDPLDLLDLADWCVANGLQNKAERLYQRVLKLEPDNEEAHRALGHRKVEGKWLTKEELERYQAEKDRAKANKLAGEEGSGGGSSPAPGPLGEGVEAKARAMIAAHQEEAKKLAKEMIDEIGLDEVTAAVTDHYMLAGQIPQKTVDDLAVLAEKIYADLSARFNHVEGFDLYKTLRKKHIFLIFKNRTDFSDGFDFAAKKWAPGMMRNKNFAMQMGNYGNSSLLIDLYKHLHHLPNNVANDVAQDFSYWHCRPSAQEAKENLRMLTWLRESFGCWSAVFHTGNNYTVRVTQTVYSSRDEVADKRSEEGMRLLAKEWATGKIPPNTYSRNLLTMMKQKLNRLNTIDLAIGYSLLDYVIRERQKEWKQFLILVRTKEYLEAWQEAFGETLVPAFQKKFKDWIEKNY